MGIVLTWMRLKNSPKPLTSAILIGLDVLVEIADASRHKSARVQ